MNTNHLKNFSYVGIGRLITLVSQAAFFLIFAALLEPSKYGELGYLIALAGTFSIVSRFGIPTTIIVFRAKGESVLANQINLLAIITTTTASIFLVFINEFSALLCLGFSFFFLYQHNLLGEQQYKSYVKNSMLRAILAYTLPFPLYFAIGFPGIILGVAIGTLISSLRLFSYTTFRIGKFSVLKEKYKVLISNFGVDSSHNLVRFIDKILVGAIFGFNFLGLYHFNLQILLAFEMLPRVLRLFLLTEESRGRKHKKISYFVVFASCMIAVAVIILSPVILPLLFPNYSDGVLGLQIIIISIIPSSISAIIIAKMQAEESTIVGFSAIVRIGSLLLLLIILGNAYGLIGMSLAVVSATIINTIFLFILFRHSKSSLKMSKS